MATIESLVSQMTLEEKAALCTGATTWSSTPVERLGIPAMVVSDGPNGVRRTVSTDELTTESLPATCFPTASCMASTWDPGLVEEVGKALGKECIALGVNVLLGPGANIKRTPLGGRNFEYFSEDPYLSGQMAVAHIKGVQSQGVGTSLKHFAVNNQEYQRFSINAEVDERALREIYLPAYENAVKQAHPWTVMCAYNKLNGTYCSENRRLLVDILEKEWGFEGLVVSDWGAVHDRVASLKGGLDWEMPGPSPRRTQAVIDAVNSGELDVALLDEACRRILGVVMKASQTKLGGSFDIDAHHALARKVAAEGMVLLKNNGILPLQAPAHIAVIGRAAQFAHFQGGGSSHVNPTRVDAPLDELRRLAGNAEITYAEGYLENDRFNQELIDQAIAAARKSEVALLFIALPASKESEGYDRTDLDLTEQQVALIKAVTNVQPNTVVILNNGAPVVMSDWIEGTAAVLEAWMMGQAGGGAIADVLYGKVNPSGKLAETFPLRLVDTPAYLHYPGENGAVRYGEGLYVGYRYYDAKQVPVLFPFGYGLSYTTFAYSNPRVSNSTFNDVDGLVVSVDVTNTGKMAGKEIVQVYVHDHKSTLSRPPKELKGFSKVELQPGETKTVSIPLDFRAFAFYNPRYEQWVTEDGEFDLLIGASAADIRGQVTVSMHSTLDLPFKLNHESTIREWLQDRRGKVVFEPIFAQMKAQMMATFGGNAEGEQAAIGMDPANMVMDMPLESILHFQESQLPQSPEDFVADLLAKAQQIP